MAYKEVLGKYHAPGAQTDPTERPVAGLRHAVLTQRAILSHKAPTWEFSSEIPQIDAQARVWSAVLNKEARENDWRTLGKNIVMEAMVSPLTVVRSGVRWGDDFFAACSLEADPMQYFLRIVDLDRYYWDGEAASWFERGWDAEEYDVSRKTLMEMAMTGEFGVDYDPDEIDMIPEALPDTDRRIRNLVAPGRNVPTDTDDELVTLVDMFFYDRTGRGDVTKVTFAKDGSGDNFLYFGPAACPTYGPFRALCFEPIPHSFTGLSLAASAFEQTQATDQLFAKIYDQAYKSRKKAVVPNGAADDDVNAINSDSQDTIRSDMAGEAQVLDLNLVSAPLIAVAQQSIEFSKSLTKNPDVMSGQSAGQKTATEFSGLMGMAQVALADSQATVEDFWAQVGRDWLWYRLHHPAMQRDTTTSLQLPTGQSVSVILTAEQREGEAMDFLCRVRPGSAMYMDEAIRSQRVDAAIAQLPMLLQLEQQTGGYFRGSEVFKDRLTRLGEDSATRYLGDQAMLDAAMQKATMAGMPTPGVIGPNPKGQTRKQDIIRSAQAPSVPQTAGAA